MWRLKSIKNFLLSLAVLLYLAPLAFAQEDSSVLAELQELTKSLNSESYSQEIQQIQYWTSLVLQDLQDSPQQTLDTQSLEEYKNLAEQMTQPAFVSMRLSEKLALLSKTQKLSNSLLMEFLAQSSVAGKSLKSKLLHTKELLKHYSDLIAILQKMSKSQLQDLGIVNEQLGLATQESENLRLQIAAIEQLEEKQYEELCYYKNIRNRVRLASYIELGIGVPCLVLGCLPIWTSSQKNIQNLFLGVGAAGAITGSASFMLTIKF